jgi:hypothetical protein
VVFAKSRITPVKIALLVAVEKVMLLPPCENVSHGIVVEFAGSALSTNAVVASLVELSPGFAVGAEGVPLNVGDASGAAPVTCPTE